MARQLPVGACIRHAVTSVRNNIAYAFRISWPWLLVLVLLGVIIFAVAGNVFSENGSEVAAVLAFLVLLVIAIVAFAAIAVNWHRYILLDEMPSGSAVLRLDAKTWRYVGNVVLITLALTFLSTLVTLPFRMAAGSTGGSDFVEVALSLIVTLVGGVLSYRLSVKLPAVALGRRDFRFAHAWEVTRGNDLQLLSVFLTQLLAYFAVLIIVYLLTSMLAALNPALGLIGIIVYTVFLWLFLIFSITILTSLYGFFVENRDF